MFTFVKISKTKNHYINVYPSPYSYYKLRKAIMDAMVEWKLNNIPRKSLGYLPHWNVVDNCLNWLLPLFHWHLNSANTMNEIINSPNVITEKPGWMVFLAGPMKASPRGWRNKLVKLAADMGLDGITFLSPRYNTMHQPSNQVEWETQGLRMCDVALFWIPNKDPKAELGTRVYAETTKMELAENLPRGKKVILGIDSEISGTRHMKFLAKRYGIKKVHTSMEQCLAELKEWIEKSQKPGEHYIESPRFDSKEQLAAHPEFVDLLAMNQTLMERWNRIVGPGDTVYVAGEFGNKDWMKFLNGDIQTVDTQSDSEAIYRRLI